MNDAAPKAARALFGIALARLGLEAWAAVFSCHPISLAFTMARLRLSLVPAGGQFGYRSSRIAGLTVSWGRIWGWP